MSELGIIPQSTALSEADPASLSELMSRDPEGYQRQDRDNIIAALRADRARREAAERTAAESGRAKPKAARAAGPAVPIDIEKLGL